MSSLIICILDRVRFETGFLHYVVEGAAADISKNSEEGFSI